MPLAPTRRITNVLHTADSLIFPRLCPGCKQGQVNPEQSKYLCGDCADRLVPFPEPRCKACGGAVDGVLDVCGECAANPCRSWDHAVSVFPYGGHVRRLIHRFKYRGAIALTPVFAEAMARDLDRHSLIQADLMTPVPIHWRRYLRRGYNQAELLTSRLSQATGIPAARVLRRTRNNPRQATLDLKTRQENVSQVFSRYGKTNVEGYHIVLVDDVLTTGATLDAAATALKEAGAAVVEVLTLARG